MEVVVSSGRRSVRSDSVGLRARLGGDADETAVLMADPSHSSDQFVGKVEAAVNRPVEVIPGISSLQIAASRARTPTEDSRFVTLHKSGDISDDLDRIRAVAGDRHLTHEEETVTRTTLSGLAERTTERKQNSPFSDLSVFIVRAE